MLWPVHGAPAGRIDEHAAWIRKEVCRFHSVCSEAKGKGIEQVVIGYPWALGDPVNEELIESLSRLADAGFGASYGAAKIGQAKLAGAWDAAKRFGLRVGEREEVERRAKSSA